MAANPAIKPIQHYDYYCFLWIAFYMQHRLSRWRIVWRQVEDEGEECILPLAVNTKRRRLRMLSYYGRMDYEDIISSTEDTEHNRRLISKALQPYEGYTIEAVHIAEDSRLYRTLGDKMTWKETCVAIDISRGYEAWFEGLNKHQRQNVRTAYNRKEKEGFEVRLEVYDDHRPIPRGLWRRLQEIYEERGGDPGSRWHLWWKRQKNAFTHILHHVEGHRIYVLLHGNEPVAYMAGLLHSGQSCYYVPRLSHNIAYNRYSPGILLICETIKQLCEEGIATLDLLLGDEPYKLAMGGKEFPLYALNWKIEN